MASLGLFGADSDPMSVTITGSDPLSATITPLPAPAEGQMGGLGHSSWQGLWPLFCNPQMQKHPRGDQRDSVLWEKVAQRNIGQKVTSVLLPVSFLGVYGAETLLLAPLGISPKGRQFLMGRG